PTVASVLIVVIVVSAVFLALVVARSGRRREWFGPRPSLDPVHSQLEPGRLRLPITPERGEEQESSDEESARGTHEPPRFQVPHEESVREIRGEVEVDRCHDDEEPDRPRRPNNADRPDP